MIIFFWLALPVFLTTVFYGGYRLYKLLKLFLPDLKKRGFIAAYSFFPLCFLAAGFLPVSRIAAFGERIGYIYLGLLMYGLMLTAAAECVRLVLFIIKKLPEKGQPRQKAHKAAGITVCALAFVIFCYGTVNARVVVTTSYTVSSEKQPGRGSLRVAVVSDFHLGYQIGVSQVRRAVAAINAQNPDIVIIAGDIFDGDTDKSFDIGRVKEEILTLKSKYGVYAVPGNHDRNIFDLQQFCAESGVTLLEDLCLPVAEGISIAGRLDRSMITGSRSDRMSLDDMLSGTDGSEYIIVVDHQPFSYEETLQSGADLIISGHTHAGQAFPADIITGLIYHNDYGYKKYGTLDTVVTSGAGWWGPPIRVGSNSEIAIIDIEFN